MDVDDHTLAERFGEVDFNQFAAIAPVSPEYLDSDDHLRVCSNNACSLVAVAAATHHDQV